MNQAYSGINGVEVFNPMNTIKDESRMSLPSTSEHKSVLVTSKFVAGIRSNFEKATQNALNNLKFEEPKIEIKPEEPKIETPVVPETSFEAFNFDKPLDFGNFNFNLDTTTEEDEEPASSPMPTVVPEEVAFDPEKFKFNFDKLEQNTYMSDYILPNTDTTEMREETKSVLSELELTMKSLTNIVSVLNQQRGDLSKLQEQLFDKDKTLTTREERLLRKEADLKSFEAKINEKTNILNEQSLMIYTREEKLSFKEKEIESLIRASEDEAKKNLDYAETLRKQAVELSRKEAEIEAKTLQLNSDFAEKSKKLKEEYEEIVAAKTRIEEIVKNFTASIQPVTSIA